MTHDDSQSDRSLLQQAQQPLTRRQLVKRAVGIGLSLPGLSGLLAATSAAALSPAAAFAETTAAVQADASRPLTPTFYQWIVDLHPSLPQVNDAFKQTMPLNFQIAPRAELWYRPLRCRSPRQEQHVVRWASCW